MTQSYFSTGEGVRKAQIAFEYLFIVGFAFILLIPIILLFYSQQAGIEDEVVGAQAQKVMDELVSAIDTVYYLGPPSKQTLKLRFPNGVNSVTIQDNVLVFVVQGTSGKYDLVGTADSNITGTIGTFSGVHVITVTALDTSVNVSEN